MENVVKTEDFLWFSSALPNLLDVIKKCSMSVEKESQTDFDHNFSSERLSRDFEQLVDQKNRSIEIMKDLVKNLKDLENEIDSLILKERFNVFMYQSHIDKKNKEIENLTTPSERPKSPIFGKPEKIEEPESQSENLKVEVNKQQNEMVESFLSFFQILTGKEEVDVWYDSDIDGFDTSLFSKKIKSQTSPIILFFEKTQNVFGLFLPKSPNCFDTLSFAIIEDSIQTPFDEIEFDETSGELTFSESGNFSLSTKKCFLRLFEKSRFVVNEKLKDFEMTRVIAITMKQDVFHDVIIQNLNQLSDHARLGNKTCQMLFDSSEDDEENFLEQLQSHKNIFVFCVDTPGNVFGFFFESIGEISYDEDKRQKFEITTRHFTFAFDNTNDESGDLQMWEMVPQKLFVMSGGDLLFSITGEISSSGVVAIFKKKFNNSFFIRLNKLYLGLLNNQLNGTDFTHKEVFCVERVIVISYS
ncbi:hypothetical protein EIN_185410 [Entamoeba invadens IP1]|uniref:hypothetical protein n=1 Tax=Entamoeba invadens IP1 TaxID=370355 RepID=UPI0002C3E9C7|nr:hypothetical protein EIN_185410 [Entamoeba invadens IP1]ELP94154.1 hypothetical protein EIN_185410 [Entamoeba invadens IP1]|eukprot:XP_004260925.1 hypothetical protein EIN_185410 [Entamoeba invadens IP1]